MGGDSRGDAGDARASTHAAHPFVVIIPARYASTRFPAKALADLGGKPMVIRVAEQAAKSGARAVYIATDDTRIADAARAHRIESVATRSDHASGTDRLAEAVHALGLADDELVINVQGDEPLIPPQLISEVAATLAGTPEASVSTACHPIHRAGDIFSTNVNKVVLDARNFALYFSRAPIPFARDAWAGVGPASGPQSRPDAPRGLPCYRHIGIYGYRAGFLKVYARLAPSPLENFEALEQLRVLWHGYRIVVSISAEEAPPGVDTIEDLEKVRKLGAGWQ